MRVCVQSKRLVTLLHGRPTTHQLMGVVSVPPGRHMPWGSGHCAVRMYWQSRLSAVKKKARKTSPCDEWMESKLGHSIQKTFELDMAEEAKNIRTGSAENDIDTIFSVLQD